MSEMLQIATGQSWEQPGAGFQWAPTSEGLDASVPRLGNDDLPGKFQQHGAPQVRPGRTFARAAAESALDAAALPVRAASAAADYFTGNDSTFSNISGKDAAESLEYLYDRTEPAQIRREETFAEGSQAQAAGKIVGEYAGGAPLAALTGRVPALSPILRATKKDRAEKLLPTVTPKFREVTAAKVADADDLHAKQGTPLKLSPEHEGLVTPEQIDRAGTAIAALDDQWIDHDIPAIDKRLDKAGELLARFEDGAHSRPTRAQGERDLLRIRELIKESNAPWLLEYMPSPKGGL